MHRPTLQITLATVLVGVASLALPSAGQSTGFNMNMHANSHVTTKEIGLPAYPGATPFKENDSDSSSGDLLFLLNSFHFSVKAASFITTDSQQQILEFYRKPLAKFGEVLECNHGKPVGSLTMTKSGLTCGDRKNDGATVHASDDGHELRAGTPEQFWIVGVDEPSNGKTKFGLVALELPKDDGSK